MLEFADIARPRIIEQRLFGGSAQAARRCICVAAVDGVQNAIIECQTKGVFDIAKEPALAITAGARLFWDNTNRRLTTTATGNFQVGLATVAALAADTTVRVVLLRTPASGT